MSSPPLTSIDVNPERIGYEAAVLLDRLMAGEPPPAAPTFLPPRGIVVRQSTDVLTIQDPVVRAALRFIRRHACEGLKIDAILTELLVSRRSLERRFRDLLGRSPKEEVTRVQLERARQLLAETDLSVAAVAHKAGFREGKYLNEVFQKKVGVTPGKYRHQVRKTPNDQAR